MYMSLSGSRHGQKGSYDEGAIYVVSWSETVTGMTSPRMGL